MAASENRTPFFWSERDECRGESISRVGLLRDWFLLGFVRVRARFEMIYWISEKYSTILRGVLRVVC